MGIPLGMDGSLGSEQTGTWMVFLRMRADTRTRTRECNLSSEEISHWEGTT